MHIVHVHVHVHPNRVEDFIKATLNNARNSIQEPGIARFDVIQNQDDPTHFILVEVYRSPEDAAKHKDTPHYRIWRDTVEAMMAEPRHSVRFTNLFPSDEGW